MQIRDARVEDSTAISELLIALDYPCTKDFVEPKIAQQLAHPDARLLVATDKRQVQGFISLNFIPQLGLDGDFCRISYFCIAPNLRSKGIGAALEAKCVELAKERGCDRIEVHCHERRAAAHRFYYRQGYFESPQYLIKSLKTID